MEALGYDSLWASDHIVIPYAIASRYPYNPTGDFPLAPTTSFLEPLVALGLVAGVTERIRLGTTVLVDADALVREIRELASLGVSHVILESRVRDLDDLTASHERVAKDVRPRV